MADPWLVFFGGRRTGIAVRAETRSNAISKARSKKRRGGSNVVAARKMSKSERKIAGKGRWVRTGPKGQKAGYNKSKRGYGPKPKTSKRPSRSKRRKRRKSA